MNFEKPEKSEFWKNEQKFLEISSFYTCVPNHNHMKYSSWDTEWDRIFCHFGPFFVFYTVPEIWHVIDVIIFHFGLYISSPKNENFKKMKKTPGDIIILYKCTKNHDHMLYCSWDMMCDRCNCYFSFWAIFCPSTPLTAQKTKISKKFKKRPEISSFNTNVPKITIICFIVPEIWHVTVIIVIFNFGLFFALLPLWQPEKWKLQKNEKNELGDIIILHMCTNNYD